MTSKGREQVFVTTISRKISRRSEAINKYLRAGRKHTHGIVEQVEHLRQEMHLLQDPGCALGRLSCCLAIYNLPTGINLTTAESTLLGSRRT